MAALATAMLRLSAASAGAPGPAFVGNADPQAPIRSVADTPAPTPPPAVQAEPSAAQRGSSPEEAMPSRENWRDPRSVFHVERNKNGNQVHYAIALDANCAWRGKQPVTNYWRRLEDDPPTEKELTFLQQRGYGLDLQHADADRVAIELKALPGRPIVIRTRQTAAGCRTAAFLQIDGRPARLDHAYVHADPGWLLPTVRYIDLFGTNEDGTPAYERKGG